MIIKKFNLKNKKEKIIYFLAVAFVLTILEGISGYVIEFTDNGTNAEDAIINVIKSIYK